jgi:hypothetical protein
MRINLSLLFILTALSLAQGVYAQYSRPRNLSDSALLDLTEHQTFRYFWDYADPVSGMARERSNTTFGYGNEVVTTGGTGFGVMAIIAATDRKYIGRDTAARRLFKLVNFLSKADSYHGAFPHWMNGATGRTIPFSRKDDGSDLVETSYLMQGLLCARQYFNGADPVEKTLRREINSLWNDIEWDWFTHGGQNVLYWHWSPNNGWAMNFPVHGWNECLIMYVLAASGQRHPVSADVYNNGWAYSNSFLNGKSFYGFTLPLGSDYGGPLFFSQYSFLGLDPRGLKDNYADYWLQNTHQTLINHAYCVDNPKKFKGYGEDCWGLTACDTYNGYNAYSPTNDGGTIAPTAALSAFPYTPEYSMKALRHFYDDLGDKIWGRYGFTDAFNLSRDWYASSDLAIDEGPIVAGIENYRSGLLWRLFMTCPEVQGGLRKLGFESPWLNQPPTAAPSQAAPTDSATITPVGIIKDLPDSALLEVVQRQTFRYFWNYAHPISGLARERDNTVHAEYYWDFINEADSVPNFSKGTFGPEACAIGGTGFGILSTIVAVQRHWIGRDTALKRLVQIVDFLTHADCYHGIYPHFMNGATGKTIPFGRLDDGADIVETSYLMMGLLTAREYFNANTPLETYFRNRVSAMWADADWNWHSNGGNRKFYWHWSPRNDFDMNFPLYGWDEALITYIISASSANHPISKELYESCWVGNPSWQNGKSYYGIRLPLGNFDYGGPLFFEQYTFMGIDPNGLKDDHQIDYAEQTRNHTLINRAWCIDNPKKYKGYGPNCWGLTAGDSYKGYVAHCPQDDRGVIQPTAALSSFPYTPEYSMQALRHFYYDLGDRIWGPYGFADGFSETHDWWGTTHLAIDEGPIVVMIENYRTGLIWNLFMNIPDVQNGLKRLGFQSPFLPLNNPK